MSTLRNSITIVFLVLLVTACGGGGGGGSGSSSSSDLPPAAPNTAISGVAFDGVIIDGNVTIYSFKDGVRGEVLGRGRTDFDGNYSVSINAASQPIMVEITGGRYIEEATGLNVDLHSSHGLRAVSQYVLGTPVNTHVTFFTHVAVALAQYYVTLGEPVATAITNATNTISNVVGVPIATTRPLDVTSATNASAALNPGLRYGFTTAAISQWTQYASRLNGTSDHAIHNSISFAQLAYDDILADGVLDGLGTVGPLSVGTIPLNADVYRHGLAVHMLRMVQSSRNRTGLRTADVLAVAKAYNDSTNPIFGTRQIIALDENGPVITNLSPANGTAVRGSFTLNADIAEITAITNVLWSRNGVALGVVPLNDFRFSINSTGLTDGPHTFSVAATNLLNTVVAASTTITVDNTPPVLSASSTSPVNDGGAFCAISGSVSDATTNVSTLQIDGNPVTFSGSSWTYLKPVTGGPTTASAYVVDAVGNARSMTIRIGSGGYTISGHPFVVTSCVFQ